MQKTLLSATVLLAATLALSLPHSALAGKDKAHHHKGGEENSGISWFSEGDGKVTIRIGTQDRAVIKDYIGKENRKHCPPGLAKKNNGCLPPGLAKKYSVGEVLPDNVEFFPVPGDLLKILSPAPKGYKYVQVDKDVLLIAEASKKVIDAVTLLSAVGR
jgi:hypothetical protein